MDTVDKIGIKNGEVYEIADAKARANIADLQDTTLNLTEKISSEETARANEDTSLQSQINVLEVQAAGDSEPMAAAATVRSAKAGGKTCTTLKERCDADYDELKDTSEKQDTRISDLEAEELGGYYFKLESDGIHVYQREI